MAKAFLRGQSGGGGKIKWNTIYGTAPEDTPVKDKAILFPDIQDPKVEPVFGLVRPETAPEGTIFILYTTRSEPFPEGQPLIDIDGITYYMSSSAQYSNGQWIDIDAYVGTSDSWYQCSWAGTGFLQLDTPATSLKRYTITGQALWESPVIPYAIYFYRSLIALPINRAFILCKNGTNAWVQAVNLTTGALEERYPQSGYYSLTSLADLYGAISSDCKTLLVLMRRSGDPKYVLVTINLSSNTHSLNTLAMDEGIVRFGLTSSTEALMSSYTNKGGIYITSLTGANIWNSGNVGSAASGIDNILARRDGVIFIEYILDGNYQHRLSAITTKTPYSLKHVQTYANGGQPSLIGFLSNGDFVYTVSNIQTLRFATVDPVTFALTEYKTINFSSYLPRANQGFVDNRDNIILWYAPKTYNLIRIDKSDQITVLPTLPHSSDSYPVAGEAITFPELYGGTII